MNQNMISILSKEAQEGFYPTPQPLAQAMVEKVLANMPKEKKWNSYNYTVLEPSAGNGMLIKAIEDAFNGTNTPKHVDVDFIEIDESLRSITKDRFSNRPKDSILHSVNCVWDDFLFYDSYKSYDLILLNPPFFMGEKHLLKAIELQRRRGGSIMCLLNAETIKNPYTAARKELVKELTEADAEIEFLSGEFAKADRKTDVEVAFIYCDIKPPAATDSLWEGIKKAEQLKHEAVKCTQLTTGKNFIENMVEQYENEVALTMELISKYEQAKPYIMNEYELPGEKALYNRPLVELVMGNNNCVVPNEYMKAVRMKYWKALFSHPKFMGMLTENLKNEYMTMLNEAENYDFNLFTINEIKKKMAKSLEKGYHDTIMSLFDKLSCVYSYTGHPEEKNVHYYNGWRTNLSWKIGKKVILPCYSVYQHYYTFTEFHPGKAYELLGDIERVLNYIDNGMTKEPEFSLQDILNTYKGTTGPVRKLDTKYFTVDFFKKGTCHITWKDMKIIDKLNIYGSQRKGWLPPGYGTKSYNAMSAEEKAVIDDFQGEAAYLNVLEESEYYLSNTNQLQLPA